jgi:tRNA uridine 5-carbamoylmethylation protein Kti12
MSDNPNDDLQPDEWQDEEFKKDVADAIAKAKTRARARLVHRALNIKNDKDEQLKQLMEAKQKAKEDIEKMQSSKGFGATISTTNEIK